MESILCKKSPSHINFFINGILHVFILLTILSLFYFIYISNLSRERFHQELGNVINDNLAPAIEKADKDGTIKNTLKKLDLQTMENYYNKDSETTTLENSWLKKSTFGVLTMVLIFLFTVIIIVKSFCKKIPLVSILKENIIMFTLIGLVEVCFFLFVARKYVPTKPSLVMQSCIDSLKKNFA
jgi:hypothetical protein